MDKSTLRCAVERLELTVNKFWKSVINFDMGIWALIVTLIVAVGASVMSAGNQNANSGLVARGEWIMALAGVVVLLVIVAASLRGFYFGRPHLVIRDTATENVRKKLLESAEVQCEACAAPVGRRVFAFRVQVVNEYACAINRVRLFCHYEDDASYFLRMRHDNMFKRSDVGELITPKEAAVFDLVNVACAAICGSCGNICKAVVVLQFADPALTQLFNYSVGVGEAFVVNLAASGLQPNGDSIVPSISKAELSLDIDDAEVDLRPTTAR